MKSWAKHVRDETLPPILLWWVGGLDAHLILDGHDRLAAALDAGVTPRVLTLWQSIDEPVELVPRQIGFDPSLAALGRDLGAAFPRMCQHVLRQIETDLVDDHPRQRAKTYLSGH